MRRPMIVGAGILSFFLIVLVLVTVHTVKTRRAAEAFLQDAVQLELQKSTFQDAQELALKHGGQPTPNCRPEYCGYFFGFRNSWLRKLRLAPDTWFTSTIAVTQNRVTSRTMMLSSGDSAFFYAKVQEMSDLPAGLRGPFSVSHRWSSEIRWRVSVGITPAASLEEHRKAYSFNLACLSKIAGCKDAKLLLLGLEWPTEQLPENSSALSP